MRTCESPSPRLRLAEWGRALPGLWRAVETMRTDYRPDSAAWPSCVFLPLERAARATLDTIRAIGHTPPASAAELSRPAITTQCLAAWRMTQGIYRIDPTLYAALIDTPIMGDIPADILLYMPEWCVYIETPGMTAPIRDGDPLPVIGLWYWLDQPPAGPLTLCIGIDIGRQPPLTVQHVPLVGTIEAAINETLRGWEAAVERGNAAPPPAEYSEAARAWLPPALSLILYLCTAAADITGRARERPGNPTLARTRRHGERLHAADGPRTWEVGARIGAALRTALAAQESDGVAGTQVRPHIRRAHWHTYLRGPRAARTRRRELRWLPPIPIAVEDCDALPSVIHPVRQ